jgi:hypothetical protein
VIHILWRKGWQKIRPVLNQSKAKDTKHYRNRGAELWSKFARLVEAGCLIPLNDQKLYEQISSRKYKQSTASLDKITLQAKGEMLSQGLPSPDRADAAVLAFTDVSVQEYLDAYEFQTPTKVVKDEASRLAELEAFMNRGLFLKEKTSPLRGSLNVLFKRARRSLMFN